jgi:hypothetical protein
MRERRGRVHGVVVGQLGCVVVVVVLIVDLRGRLTVRVANLYVSEP